MTGFGCFLSEKIILDKNQFKLSYNKVNVNSFKHIITGGTYE